jgi:hypothetical protein
MTCPELKVCEKCGGKGFIPTGERWGSSKLITLMDEHGGEYFLVEISYGPIPQQKIASASLSDSGYYACVLSNEFGSINSDTVWLTVLSPPSITLDPVAQLKCVGDQVTFSVAASGSSPITYQWYNTNGQLGGATNSSYVINSASLNDASSYYCIAGNVCNSDQSNGANLSIRTAPTMSSLTPANSICETSNITFAASASGSDTISYQWYKDLTEIASANSSSYNITSASTSDAGSYYCKATNACGADSTNISVLTVNTKPLITTQSSSTTLCENQSMTFSVTASGTPPLSYQWYGPAGSISGAIGNTYTINSVSSSDAGSYYCIVSNACEPTGVSSSSISLTVNTAPSISAQTNSFSVCSGSQADFSVSATGSNPLSYQWYKNGQSIGGATASTYTISSATDTAAGNFSCVVSNSCGIATTTSIALSINTAPNIVSQTSSNVSACSGQSMTFSVTATGTSPLSYQWYDGSGAISGATSSSYTINSVSSSDAGSYYCKVSNVCNSTGVQSSSISLTVYSAPVITAQSGNQSVCSGSAAYFSVTASGSPTPSYQWYYDTLAIGSATNPTHSISSASTTDAGTYYCVASNLCGSVSSTLKNLTVNTAPTILNVSSSPITVCEGQSATMSVTASGTSPLSYQWYDGSGAISGATSSSYTINSVSSSDAGSYYCKVSNVCNSTGIQSSSISLTVYSAPVLTAQSGNQSVCSGSAAYFSVTASGSPTPSYQWYYDTLAIGSATNPTHSISSASTTDAGTYYCVASNLCGSVSSTLKNLTVNTAPTILNVSSSPITVCEGQSATMSVTASGTSPLSYQWYDGSGAISGATSSSYTINSVSSSDAGSYYCKVSNVCNSTGVQSSSISLTVKSAAVIIAQSGTTEACSGSSASFSVTASGSSPLSYQWYKNNQAVTGATNNTLVLSTTTSASAGSYYCIISNSCGTATSVVTNLVINSPVSISSQSTTSSVCEGGSITLSVTAGGSAPIAYQWFKGNASIAGAISSTYTISSASTSDAATYYCQVKNDCDSLMSSPIVLSILQSPAITAQSATSNACVGSSANFSVTATGNLPLSYQWYKDNQAISGATNNTYAISSTSTSSAGIYYCVVSNSCGSVSSPNMTLSINQSPSISYLTPSTTVCAGQSTTFSVTAVGSSPFTYQWYKDNNPISGEINSSFTLSSVSVNDSATYYVKVRNLCDSVMSNGIVLTVRQAPTISSQSSSTNVCLNGSAILSVTATGSLPLFYQWYKDNSAISSATNNTYAINSATTNSGGNYYCIVSNSCGNVSTSNITLGINEPPVITYHTANTSLCEGQNMTLSVSATGTNPMTYQWYKGGNAIASATNSSYSIFSVSTADAGSYYCKVYNPCSTGGVQSNSIQLTVKQAPVLTAQPISGSVCESSSSSKTFSVTASGTSPITYQWYKDGVAINNAKNNTYTVNPVTLADAGNYYCIATNDCGSAKSNAAVLQVNTKPSIISVSDSMTACAGNSVVMNVVAEGTAPLSYQWYYNLMPIQNETNSFYFDSKVETTDQGNYYCSITNACGSATSSMIQLLVNSPIEITRESGDSSKCEHDQAYFEVQATGTSPVSYQWYNDAGVIVGATTNTYLINDIDLADAGFYYCEITNPCGSVLSKLKKLDVHANPVVSLGNDTLFCKGGSITLSPGTGYFCLWNTGSINPELRVVESGEYFVHVTDVHACQAYSDTVQVDVLEPFEGEEICVVSGDPATGKNLIAWERTQGQRTAYYNIYRETSASGVYEIIGSRPFDSVSVFVDQNSNPKQKAYRYRITAVDSCGNESAPSQHHKTIHLTVNQGVGNTNNLIWSHYEGFTFSSYYIYRGTHPDSLKEIDIIQSNLNSYTDLNPPQGVLYYRIAVQMPDTCNPQILRGQTSKGPFSQSMSNMKDYSTGQVDYVEAYPTLISIDSSYGASGTIEVFTNLTDWKVESSQGWLSVERDLATSTITIRALAANEYDYARSAYVAITSGGKLPPFVISVMQRGLDNSISIKEPESVEAEDIFVYPNPFKSATVFELPACENKMRIIEIIDMNGRVVHRDQDVEGHTYYYADSDLSKGLYYVRIIADRIYTAKIIKR